VLIVPALYILIEGIGKKKPVPVVENKSEEVI